MEVFFLILFFFAFLIQVCLLLFIFRRLLWFKEIKKSNSGRGISIIIAAHNEKKNLQRLVPLLLNQNYPDFEIIISNDRSTDGTLEYLSSINHSKLRVITIENIPNGFNPKKFALTKAIELSQKDVLMLTDADCYPASNEWLTLMESHLGREKEIVLGYSPYLQNPGLLNLFIRYETFITGIQYLSYALLGKPYMGVGRNLGYLKKIFLISEGFKEDQGQLGGDDDLFIGKVANSTNSAICISPDSHMYSIPKATWKDFRVQKMRHLSAGQRYSGFNKLLSALFPVSLILLYFSMFFLSYYNVNFSYIVSIFILRTLVLIVIFALITRKLQETIKWFWLPVLDLLFVFYYLITGTLTIFSKNIKWR